MHGLALTLDADAAARELLLGKLLGREGELSASDIKAVVKLTDGYSNADLANVCRHDRRDLLNGFSSGKKALIFWSTDSHRGDVPPYHT